MGITDLAKEAVDLMGRFCDCFDWIQLLRVSRKNQNQKLFCLQIKKSTPPLFKAFPKEFKGKLEFGNGYDNQRDNYHKFLSITLEFPSLIVAKND